ncbi:MAG: hypothetical protein IJQ35_06630 [Bacteroidales bacterium]|nr:hypothetical protein [Bacteroidales bacterium]
MRKLIPWMMGMALLAACEKENPGSPGPSPADVAVVHLSVSGADGASTKLSGLDYELHEEPVDHWAWFFFERSTGSLAAMGTAGRAEKVTKTLRTGVYDVFAIANYPESVDLGAIRTRNRFLALRARLSDNGTGSMLMAAGTADSEGVVLSKERPEAEITLHLKRLVSKITVSGITRRFESPSLGEKQLTLKHIYLTNVYPETLYARDLTKEELPDSQASWYNAMGWHHPGALAEDRETDRFLAERNLDLNLPQNGTAGLNLSFYFYPNPLPFQADSHAPDWNGPRCTRLVLETELDGKTYYYQATLPKDDGQPAISRNTAFLVQCTLTRLGSTDPEQVIPGSLEAVFTAVTGAWEGDYDVNENS